MKLDIKIEMRGIDTIRENPKNPRVIPDRAVENLAKGIQMFGFLVPIVIGKGKIAMIAAGHTRYRAAKLLKLAEVPCVQAAHLSAKQLKAFALADNKLAEATGWDEALLADALGDFDADDLPGWTPDDIEDALDAVTGGGDGDGGANDGDDGDGPSDGTQTVTGGDPTKAVTVYFRVPAAIRESASEAIRDLIDEKVEEWRQTLPPGTTTPAYGSEVE